MREERAKAAVFALEPPESEAARFCLSSYYQELAARFEAGFDPVFNPVDDADMRPPSGYLLLARLDGAAAGCGVLVCHPDQKLGEIKRVWIAPQARGHGLARRVLHRLEAIAREQGLAYLRLDTNRVLHEAHRLYRSEGYSEIARFNDNPYAHHWFGKRLTAPSAS